MIHTMLILLGALSIWMGIQIIMLLFWYKAEEGAIVVAGSLEPHWFQW